MAFRDIFRSIWSLQLFSNRMTFFETRTSIIHSTYPLDGSFFNLLLPSCKNISPRTIPQIGGPIPLPPLQGKLQYII